MKKRLLSILLVLCMVVALLPGTAWAADFVIEDGVLTEYTGSGGAVTIPSSVTAIGGFAFYGCNSLTSVTIPDSVTSIGINAFAYCSSLTSVTIPSSVTSIGDYAFGECSSLTSVTIPNSVTSIEHDAFDDTPWLESLGQLAVVNGILFKYQGNGGTVAIPGNVTSIGDFAFWGYSNLTNVTIPSSVTSIGGYAFWECESLTSVTIPSSVTSIGGFAFADTPWLESLGEFAIVNGILLKYQGYGGAITIPSDVTSIGEYAFFKCNSLVSVTIPNSVTSIGNSAFSCSSLTSVIIPDSVTNIGSSAFSGCESLTSVTIPDSVTRIERSVFSNCAGLSNVTIPDSVISIEVEAFYECSSLTSITIPSSVTSIEYDVFGRCSSLTSINVSSGNTAYRSVDGVLFNADQTLLHTYPMGKSTTSYSIPNSVITIGDYAFWDCSNLTSVTISGNISTIGENAFFDCSSLRSMTIPASVTSIGANAFFNCSNLNVYYGGSEDQWKLIIYIDYNDDLLNAKIHYNSTGPKVMISPQKLTVDGKSIDCEKYNIDGSNYFKLRDLAYMLKDTGSRFGVGYDGATNTVSITTGTAYTSAGGELTTGADKSGTAKPSSQTILIDGEPRTDLMVYNIGGNNFFQLRELGTALGFDVDYNSTTNTAIVNSRKTESPDKAAKEKYRAIVGQASSYDYQADFDKPTGYKYALVQMQPNDPVPTLLLEMETSEYLCYVRVFQYDPNTKTVRQPTNVVLMEGTAQIGGYRGSLAMAGDGNGLLSTELYSGTGETTVTRTTFSGASLVQSTVWEGRIDKMPGTITTVDIQWHDIRDLSAL